MENQQAKLPQKNPIHEMEKKWLEYWEKEKIYKFNPRTRKEIYSIDAPPPTVSGKMHVGHAYSYAQGDFVARYKRMRGFELFYPFGTDDNGLPTEKLVEKLRNVRSKEMPRKDFIELCLKTLKEIMPAFVQGWKNLGISCDYEIHYSTIDERSRRISQRAFIELYEKGLIYREEFPTLFCPGCETPIAQAELEDKEKKSLFNTISFSTSGKELLIATTRPELLGACVAVFVNPKDKRYKTFIGKRAQVPLYEYKVPIIADESASMEKGTGVLMVCSYGDKYDVDAIKRHKLEPRVIFEFNGRLKDGRYNGMKILEARKKILQELKESGALVEQKEITRVMNVHDKCGTEIEFLPTEQWFIKILDKKSDLIKQGRKIKWNPEFMFKRYENWINGLEWDWSVSRERYFGVPIPVWICRDCDVVILADEKELPVDPLQTRKKCLKCGKEAEGEKKVLDTWATSSLTPQIASEIVGGKVKLPYALRTQAHDIIRTWAFYTIVRALYHDQNIPWEEIMISGFVTLGGEKMSKSKGNYVEPLAVMETYGADALRYWAASSKLGQDSDYMEKDLVAGKKFVIKIANAANFVFMNLLHQAKVPAKLIAADRIFLSQLNELIERATKEFDDFNYSKAKSELDNFFWKHFADNYLEIVKWRVYNGSDAEKASAFFALYNALLAIVKMFAPFTPFVCEEVYQKHFASYEKGKSVHLEEWPNRLEISEHRHDAKIWEKLVEVIGKVRQAKSEAKRAMNSQIELTLGKEDLKILEEVLPDLAHVVNCVGEIRKGEFSATFV